MAEALSAFFKTFASPMILPNNMTLPAGTGSSLLLNGVGPKKMARTSPDGRYPMSPALTRTVAVKCV